MSETGDRTVRLALAFLAGQLLLALAIVVGLLLSGVRPLDTAAMLTLVVLAPLAWLASRVALAEWRTGSISGGPGES